jgi:hypothetical protein
MDTSDLRALFPSLPEEVLSEVEGDIRLNRPNFDKFFSSVSEDVQVYVPSVDPGKYLCSFSKNEVIERKFAGDKIKLDVLREGKLLKTEMTLKRFTPYVKLGEQFDRRPEYLVYAGLVFQPMDKNLMDAYGFRDPILSYVFDNYLNKKIYVERPEVVVLTQVLPDDVTSYVTSQAPGIVESVNGVKIKTMKDLKEALAKPGAKPDFTVIEMYERGRPLVLKRSLAEEAHPRIMKNYRISEDSYLGE